MKLQDLTWKEVEEYLTKRKDVLVPIGSIEEHGYHLPLSTDAFIAERIAEEVSRRTGVLVAPTIPYGVCRSTVGYAGTISVTLEGFKKFVHDVLTNLRSQGFERFYLFTAHAGGAHIVAIEEAARSMKVKTKASVYLVTPNDVDLSNIVETPWDFHAGEAETSIMLYLAPDRVKLDKAVDERVKKGLEVLDRWKPTKSGVFGKPSLASRKKGKRIFQGFVDKLVEVVRGAEG